MGRWHCIVRKRGAMRFAWLSLTRTTSATSARWTRRGDGGWMGRRPRNAAYWLLSQRQWRERCFWGLHAPTINSHYLISRQLVSSIFNQITLILPFATATFVPSFHTRAKESAHSVNLLAVTEVVGIESSKLGLGCCAITDSTFCNSHLCSIISNESRRFSTISKSVSCDGSSLPWEFEARPGMLCYYWFYLLQQPPLFHHFKWEPKIQHHQ